MSFLSQNISYSHPELCFMDYEKDKKSLINYVINDYLLRDIYQDVLKTRSVSNMIISFNNYSGSWELELKIEYNNEKGKNLSKSTYDKIDKMQSNVFSYFSEIADFLNLFEKKETEYIDIDLNQIRENKKNKKHNTTTFPIDGSFNLESQGGIIEISENDIMSGKAHLDYYYLKNAIELRKDKALLNILCNFENKYNTSEIHIENKELKTKNIEVESDPLFEDLKNLLLCPSMLSVIKDKTLNIDLKMLRDQVFFANSNQFTRNVIEEEFKVIDVLMERKKIMDNISNEETLVINKKRI